MTSVTWGSGSGTGTSGLWGTGSNWSSGSAPTSSQSVTISASGSYTITIAAGTVANAGTLTLNDSGAVLVDDGNLLIASTFFVTAGTFDLASTGTLTGGTVSVAASTGTFALGGGTLSGVTYDGTLDLSETAAAVTIENGITFAGAGGSGAATINLIGTGAQLRQSGSGTLSNATLDIGTSSTSVTGMGGTLSVLDVGGAGVLTLGTTFVVKDTAGSGVSMIEDAGGAGDEVINKGSITGSASSSGATLVIAGNKFANMAGASITESGSGTIAIEDATFTNAGTITQSGSGEIVIGGVGTTTLSTQDTSSFTNTGSIVVSKGTLYIEGGTFTNSGGISVSAGTLDIGSNGSPLDTGVTTAWSSTAGIAVSGKATLDLGGSFKTATLDEVSLSGTKATIEITGTLSNAGGTIDVGTGANLTSLQLGGGYVTLPDGSYQNVGGYIYGGTIHDAGNGTGGGLSFDYGTMKDVTYQGTLYINSDSSANLTIQDGITLEGLNGTGPGAIVIGATGSNTYLGIYSGASGTTTLDNATITLGDNSSRGTYNATTYQWSGHSAYIYMEQSAPDTAQTLIFGAGLTINELNSGSGSSAKTAHYVQILDKGYEGGGVTDVNSVIINDGTINATSPTGSFDIQTENFVNNGDIFLSGGGVFEVDTYQQFYVAGGSTHTGGFYNTGTIVSTGGTLAIDTNNTGPSASTPVQDAGTNTGTIITTDTYIQLGGTLTAGFMEHVSATGGQTYLESYGYLYNQNADGSAGTLTIGSGAASVANQLVLGGTIIGGTIIDTGDGMVTHDGILQDVTYEGTLDPSVGSTLTTSTYKVGSTTETLTTYSFYNSILISDGITLTGSDGSGTGSIILNNGVSLYGQGSVTIDDTDITLGSSETVTLTKGTDGVHTTGVLNVVLGESPNYNGTFALGSAVTVTQTGASDTLSTGGNGDEFINAGTIDVASAGTILIAGIAGASNEFDNTGLLNVGSGTVTDTAAVFNNDGTVEIGNGIFSASGAVTGSGSFTLLTGASVTFASTVAAGETVVFDDPATLIVGDAPGFAATVSAFGSGDTIDLSTIGYDPDGSASLQSGDVLAVTENSVTTDIQLAGDFTGATFHLAQAGAGTDITVTGEPLCFLRGTRIRTATGDVLVENIRPGDLVCNPGAPLTPVIWVGTGKLMVPRGRRSPATPVIIRRDAIAPNVPDADLRVTKGHALLLDGVLIPAEFLVNHRSILWDDSTAEAEYFHIETTRHSILLANNCPSESYRDEGNRWMFHNADPAWAVRDLPPCAPVLTGGPVVDSVWQRLLERSGQRLKLPVTEEPDLHVLVDGKRIDGTWVGTREFHAQLPRGLRALAIGSRAAAQDELGYFRDPRCLGVAIASIVLWRGKTRCVIPASEPLLRQGFHEYEPAEDCIWTNGQGVVPAEFLSLSFDRITLHIRHTTRYPREVCAKAA